MPSTFTWFDHSEHDRRRVLDAIDRFSESETRDELGLGAIRDAFADRFFPGTSTIQTRARYFLFTAWMYQSLEEKRVDSGTIAARARREELKLRDALLESDDDDGTFGRLAGAALKRLPSNIYWNGLGAWNIRLFKGSQDEYHRYFTRLLERRHEGTRNDDKDLVDGVSLHTWHPHLPKAPEDFPDAASFALTREEARYLAERIEFSAPRSMLALILRRGYGLEGDYPWAHPQSAEFPDHLRTDLEHARLLAETTHGAALLYNLLLSEQLPEGEKRDASVEGFRQELDDWCEELGPRAQTIETWDRKAFWKIVHDLIGVRPRTEEFVERWLALRPWSAKSRASDDRIVRALVRDREQQLKRGRARIGNPRALELWGGSSGTARLSYRWPPAKRLLRDIRQGLGLEVA